MKKKFLSLLCNETHRCNVPIAIGSNACPSQEGNNPNNFAYKIFFNLFLVMLLIVSGCNKTSDGASMWKGTYAANGSNTNNISKVIVTEVDASTISLQLLFYNDSAISIPPYKLQNSFSMPITFNDSLPGTGGNIVFTGTANMAANADSLVIKAKGTSLGTDSVMVLYFRGKRTAF